MTDAKTDTKLLDKACQELQKVALAKATGGPGLIEYGDFCGMFKLGLPHLNDVMVRFLLDIVEHCYVRGWPDYACLVVRRDTHRPGQGWFRAHSVSAVQPVGVKFWTVMQADCYARAATHTIP